MDETECYAHRRRAYHLHHRLQSQGLLLRKRRETRATAALGGGFMILDAKTKVVLAGPEYGLTLDEVEAWATSPRRC
jgi:hypothetical protein